MAVPADIRAVARPKNTIVDDSGREGIDAHVVYRKKQISGDRYSFKDAKPSAKDV